MAAKKAKKAKAKLRKTKGVSRGQHVKALENIVDTLTTDVVKALDIKEEKKSLLKDIRKLREQKASLQLNVRSLTKTRERLQRNMQKKNKEAANLKSKIRRLKESNADLTSEQVNLETKVKHLTGETVKMQDSLDRTNDLLMKLKYEVKAFDEEIKA